MTDRHRNHSDRLLTLFSLSRSFAFCLQWKNNNPYTFILLSFLLYYEDDQEERTVREIN